jgi:hypothetical protein
MQSGNTTNGVKKPSILSLVNYIKIEETVTFDSFHVLENIAKYTVQRLINFRTINQSTREYCKNTFTHPSLWRHSTTMQDEQSRTTNSKKKSSSKQTTSDDNIDIKTTFASTPTWVLASAANNFSPRPEHINAVIADVETFLASVQMPSIYSQDYKVSKFFSEFSYFMGIQKINAITSAMDLIVFAITKSDQRYPTAYLFYYSMLSSLYSALQAPIICPEKIDLLYNRSIEFLCIHSGLFPPSEVLSVYHQLIHLAKFIHYGGPLRCHTTLPMERHMIKVKSNVITGGSSFAQAASKKEFSQELFDLSDKYKDDRYAFVHGDNDRSSGCYSLDDDNNYAYSDFSMKLLKKNQKQSECIVSNYYNNDTSSMMYHRQGLLDFIINEGNELQSQPEIISPLFRFYLLFTALKSDSDCRKVNMISRSTTFAQWLYSVVCIENEQEYIQFKEFFISFSNLHNINIVDNDFSVVWEIESLFNTMETYESAYIWGTFFKSRGYEYAEWGDPQLVPATTAYGSERIKIANNEHNQLKTTWRDKRQSRSWCRIFCKNITKANNRNQQCGQINYFFRLNIPSDKLLNGIPVAAITKRKCTNVSRRHGVPHTPGESYFENLFEVDCKDCTLFDPRHRFVAAYNIFSCPLAVVALDDSKKPCPNPKMVSSDTIIYASILLLYMLRRERECIHLSDDVRSKLHPYYNPDKLNCLKV